jgi:hypothetical protein
MFPHNVNFWITSWSYNIDWKKSNIIMHQIKKLRKNRYKLLLKREWSKIIDKFEMQYDWSDYVSIYDQFWKHIWRELISKEKSIFIEWNKYRKAQTQTHWELNISTPRESIDLDLVFVA